MYIGAGNSEAVRIKSDGKVGISETSPTALLHIKRGGSSYTAANLAESAGGAGVFRIQPDGTNQTSLFASSVHNYRVALQVSGSSSGDNGLVLQPFAGNVGIGTSQPSDVLTITDGASPYAADAKRLLQLKRDATNGHDDNSLCSILFGNNSNGFHIGYGGTTDRFRFIDGGGVERVSFVNGGNVGIGTTAPSGSLHVNGANPTVFITNSTQDGASTMIRMTEKKEVDGNAGGYIHYNGSANVFHLGTHISGTDTGHIYLPRDGSGEVGIGTAAPGGVLDIWIGSSRVFQVQGDGVGVGNNNPGNYGTLHVTGTGDTSITGSTFYDGYGEINVSGNVVGPHVLCLSSTAEQSTSDYGIQNMGPSMVFRGQPGNGLDGGATFAAIAGTFDQSNSTYAAKGNLRFFTSAGYEFSPHYGTEMKERMRIDSTGNIFMISQRSNLNFNQDGLAIGESNGVFAYFERSASTANSILYLHRRNGDGQHISFYESNTQDGYIQTSSGVVSLVGFQGSHEASGIPIDTPTGTVVSTIDEEFKYRHANVKISDTVGDKRVYGVVENFNEEQNDDTGHTHPAHFNIASVGVGHIRVTGSCAGGDLLESNGDGLAKVQDDDIIRSKTIGKVTATVPLPVIVVKLSTSVLLIGVPPTLIVEASVSITLAVI